jgi:hypothetical protein
MTEPRQIPFQLLELAFVATNDLIPVNNQLDAHLMYLFISLLYMLRVTQCSSSGESIVSIHHMVCLTLCR